MTKAEIARANAAHDLETTRFVGKGDLVSREDLEATQYVDFQSFRPATRRKTLLLRGAVVGLLLLSLLLAASAYRQAHPVGRQTVAGHRH